MNVERIAELVDLWMGDASFREEVRAEPVEAVRRRGFELSEDEIAAVRGVDWALSDEDLTARINNQILAV